MSSSLLRREISMVRAMAELMLWRQKLFPHLKKNLTAVLVILKTLERSFLCLWRSSRSSLRRRASESLHNPAQEMMKLPLMTTRREHVTSARNLDTTSLSVHSGTMRTRRRRRRRRARNMILMTRRRNPQSLLPSLHRSLHNTRRAHLARLVLLLARRWIQRGSLLLRRRR